MLKPMYGANGSTTLVDGVTVRTIVAAPGIATEVHYIKWIQWYNETTGENPVFKVYDTGLVHLLIKIADIGDTQTAPYAFYPGYGMIVFPTPILCTAGAAITATSLSATGDLWVQVGGFTGEAGLNVGAMG